MSLWSSAQAATVTQPPESVAGMFSVLRHSSATPLPRAEARTLARLRARAPGRHVRLDVSQTRQVGPRSARLYLVPGTNGICAVHGRRGACSDDLAHLSRQGIRFWVVRRRDRTTGARPIDLYGALPDGLTAITVEPYAWPNWRRGVMGTNAHRNGYVMHLRGSITQMILTGPRGGVSIGPLAHPG